MSLRIKTRQWSMIAGATAFGLGGYVVLPMVLPTPDITALALPAVGAALILDTLKGTAEHRRCLWTTAAWSCLVGAATVGLWPLKEPLSYLTAIFREWREAGWPVLRAAREAARRIELYPGADQAEIGVAASIGALCLGLAICLPIAGLRRSSLQDSRRSPTGPWKADWMNPQDIAHLKRNRIGLPLALHAGRMLRYKKNDARGWRGGHHLVIAGTRGGKGISAVIPAILDHVGPVVALDIKGENSAITRRYRCAQGRTVAVLNPFGVVGSSEFQLNPLDYIRLSHLSRDIDVVADGLVRPETGDGAHFAELARALIAAAIEVVVVQAEPVDRNLITVVNLLLSKDLDATLQAWTENGDLIGYRPAQVAATILRAGDRERGSIQTSVAKAFDWMKSDEMRHFLACSTFRLDDLLDDKLDIFIVVPLDQLERQGVFMRLVTNLVLGSVVRQDGRRKVAAPILLVLDEFVRLGRMEQVMNIANVAAGVGIEALFVTQDMGQVEKAYGPEDARSIFGSCITKRVFNINDIDTAEWVARHFGDNTVYSQQVREAGNPNEGQGLSYSEHGQQIMTAQEIMTMKTDELVLLVGNRSPLVAKQNRYFENSRYNRQWDENPL